MFSFMLWVVDLVLWLSCHKTTKKRSMIPQQKNNLEMIHDSCHTGEVTPSYSVAFGCYLISFEWRNTVLNSSCWLLLLSSEFKLELIYAQETLSRSPLTSIENMNSQNQQKQSITQNSSKFQKFWDDLNSMPFRHRNFHFSDKHPMSPQDCQSATGGKNRRIRQSFFGQSIQISSAAGAPSHRGVDYLIVITPIFGDKINHRYNIAIFIMKKHIQTSIWATRMILNTWIFRAILGETEPFLN